MEGKKIYSLVKLLQPFALIARYNTENEDVRFELLTLEEEKLVVPKLEEVCRDDLAQAGLKLKP